MALRIAGWAAILLSLIAFMPSTQPGAMSVIGFYLCLFSLLLSAFASHMGSIYYHRLVLLLSAINVFAVNDGTRILMSGYQHEWIYTGSMYGILFVIVFICHFLIRKGAPSTTLFKS